MLPTQQKKPNRNTLTTVNTDGSRFFLHPADVRGRFTVLRKIVAAFLIAIYVSLPWIPIGGHPAVFLDIADRRFHLFGHTLAFQDLWLLFFLITGVGFLLFLITALFGRLWCGWACPQTVFLEQVYRRIERLIEGDAQARRKLDAAPWNGEKFLRRGGKQAVFLLISAVIAHLFLSYFVSIPELWHMMHTAPTEHWTAFVFVGVATLVLYGNFAWFREQLCIIICPYGRFQSALVDDDSISIAYDTTRGEPRGKPGTPDAGACVDCNRCVAVCPTGIDIRQGLQMECIACTACVDACDEVMTKLKRPTGLIRYDSLTGLRGQKRRFLRPRLIVYGFFMLAGATAATISLSRIEDAYILALRMPGMPFIVEPTSIRNQYHLRIVNKTDSERAYTLALVSAGAPLIIHGAEEPITVEPLGEKLVPVVVQVSRENYQGRFTIEFVVTEPEGNLRLTRSIEFVGPDVRLLNDEAPKKS